MDKKNAILVKNFAKDLKLLQAIVPNAIETQHFGRKRAVVYLSNRQEANDAFARLWAAFKGTTTHVQFLQTNEAVHKNQQCRKLAKITRGTQTDWQWKDVGSLPESHVRKLYGIDDDIRFDRPPPPYLFYNYPPATMDIVDAISIELMKNSAFYIQVLHVMNRMNLEPPFAAKEVHFRRGVPRSIAIQTGEDVLENAKSASSSESELTEDDVEIKIPVKRKKVATPDQMQKRARLLLQGVLHTTQLLKETNKEKSTKVVKKVFEKVPIKSTAIEIKMPASKPAFVPPADLSVLKISEEAEKTLPIFKNYVRGEESDKLYIKNLAKSTTTDDLVALYARFVVNAQEDLHVRVMQQGRMKGQAFVTFQSKSVDNVVTAKLALEATHGLRLREKPLVVCFGKKRETSS